MTPSQCALHLVNILNSYKKCNLPNIPIIPDEEIIDQMGAWLYLDVVSHGNPYLCGVGGSIHLLKQHWLKFKVWIDPSYNNFAKMMDLKLALKIVRDLGAQKV